MWSDDLEPYSDYDPDLTHAEALRDEGHDPGCDCEWCEDARLDAAADQVQANDEVEDDNGE